MPFKRQWDSSCPKEWDRWEADGTIWVIQDLPPEDDEEANKILVEHLIPDEALCIVSGVAQDPLSVRSMAEFWRECLAQRTSLACYAETSDGRKLVALNCCIVVCDSEKDEPEIEGGPWINVYNALKYVETKCNVFEYLGMSQVLYAMGLCVRREYRGAKLGARLLSAREPLSLSLGIEGTSTVFTGPASQKSAARAGFTTIADVTMKELADAGLKYPPDERVIKLMVKKYRL